MTAMTAAVTPAVRVLEYSLIAYRRSYRASLFSSFVQPVLFLTAMGLGLGGIVDRSGATSALGGVSYLAFLAPGLLVAAGMQTAFTESTFPVVAGINWVRTYYAMIATPVTTGAVAAGQIGFILVRLALGATIFSVVMIGFGVVVSPGAFLIGIFASMLTGLAFATPICAFSATQRNGTSFNALFRFGMTPLFLFSGTFFPVERLPPLLQAVATLTPLYHGVALARGAALGTLDPEAAAIHVTYLGVLAAIGFVACLYTFRRRLVS
ncbi:MAG TPA: ABC transporter permease [Candidatus Binatia bacterium]|nr:ABC transporter permease [Candidatus Binatia bacterium]